ncbi:MAG: ATP-binding protein [Candidatus Aminicenantes bacterium]|nr:ATP-binding protein [Candidatus Aminicenantes bacterium]
MKLSKFDIGAEIISILTRGMYQDPRDALREYIQNGVDAHAKNIKLKIRQNTIVIEDDGDGMDYKILRKALRVGVSDKKPGTDVGFMGIGIYSAFHLCDSLTIFSRTKINLPCKVEIDFKSMRELLENQKELRLNGNISSEELIDLQTLLEKYIDLSEEDTISAEEFPGTGTRVELVGLDPHFYEDLTDFDKVAGYIKDVVPLHFDKDKFTYGEEIENKITEICKKSNASFELVNVELQVNNIRERLFKPYFDSDFHNDNPQEPKFKELKYGDKLLGVAWGCLNSTRNKISKSTKRGFLIKKQGFAIGRRENVVQYFKSRTHFDRYIGEIIVVSQELLPNSSRDDFELSSLRTIFREILADVARKLNEESNTFQDRTKALEQIGEFKAEIKEINALYNRYEKNPDDLVDHIVNLNEILKKVESIIKRNVLKGNEHEDAKNLEKSLKELIKEIQGTINSLTKPKEKQGRKKISDKQTKIAEDLAAVSIAEAKIKKHESLIEVLNDLDIEPTEELVKVLNLVDEKFIQGYASSKSEYYKLLRELKEEVINSID